MEPKSDISPHSPPPIKLPPNLITPLFSTQLEGTGAPLVDVSDSSPYWDQVNLANSTEREALQQKLLKQSESNWAAGGYLSYRERFFRALELDQMVQEKRFTHLGIDIVVPVGLKLYAPLDGVVVHHFREEGRGNYGGLVVLKHSIEGMPDFFSLYGHLGEYMEAPVGTVLKQGQEFGIIGDRNENGGYTPHLHLQLLTEKGYRLGYVAKGYCSLGLVSSIEESCPDPSWLFQTGATTPKPFNRHRPTTQIVGSNKAVE